MEKENRNGWKKKIEMDGKRKQKWTEKEKIEIDRKRKQKWTEEEKIEMDGRRENRNGRKKRKFHVRGDTQIIKKEVGELENKENLQMVVWRNIKDVRRLVK